jgi:hypothetical protein
LIARGIRRRPLADLADTLEATPARAGLARSARSLGRLPRRQGVTASGDVRELPRGARRDARTATRSRPAWPTPCGSARRARRS